MEIEEMQALWSDMSDQLEQQKKLTNEIIMQMTHVRYARKFQTIFTVEAMGAVICFLLAIGLAVNFYKLDTLYFKLSGVYTLVILVLYPLLVLRTLLRLKRLNITKKNYTEILVDFMKEKKRILAIQKFGAFFYIPLMPACLLVAVKIIKDKNFLTMDKSLSLYIFIGITLLLSTYITWWGYNHYKKITNSAEHILKELEE